MDISANKLELVVASVTGMATLLDMRVVGILVGTKASFS